MKIFVFRHFSSFLTFFNCACHSRSRHWNFSWPFGDHHSTSFLSNFSGNDIRFSCECWNNSHASTWCRRPTVNQVAAGRARRAELFEMFNKEFPSRGDVCKMFHIFDSVFKSEYIKKTNSSNGVPAFEKHKKSRDFLKKILMKAFPNKMINHECNGSTLLIRSNNRKKSSDPS